MSSQPSMPKLYPAYYVNPAHDAGVKRAYLQTYVEILYRMQVHVQLIPNTDGLQGACITASSICKILKYGPKTYYRHLRWLTDRGFLKIHHGPAPYGTILRANWIVPTSEMKAIVADAQSRAKAKKLAGKTVNGNGDLPPGISNKVLMSSLGGAFDANLLGQSGLTLEDSIEVDTDESTNAPAVADAPTAFAKLQEDYVLSIFKKKAKEGIKVVIDECLKSNWAPPKSAFGERSLLAMISILKKAHTHGIQPEAMFCKLRSCVANWAESRTQLKGKYATYASHQHGPTIVALNGCFNELFLDPPNHLPANLSD